MITHDRLPFLPLPAVTDKTGSRVYRTPRGDFPSVTTVLKKALGSKRLDAWQAKVGETAANEISYSARTRGNAIHKIFEDYLEGKPIKAGAINYATFHRVKHIFDRNDVKVYGIELPLWSDDLATAGTTDLLARWNDKYNAITDYKTARRPLKPDDDRIKKYRLQATIYGMMAEERYGIEVPYNMLIILNSEDHPQLDITPSKVFRDEAREIFYEQKKLRI